MMAAELILDVLSNKRRTFWEKKKKKKAIRLPLSPQAAS
jgi:hypothetical protein